MLPVEVIRVILLIPLLLMALSRLLMTAAVLMLLVIILRRPLLMLLMLILLRLLSLLLVFLSVRWLRRWWRAHGVCEYRVPCVDGSPTQCARLGVDATRREHRRESH